MSRQCDSCGKKTSFGNTISRRGLPKYQGGVGLKTTGINRRTFKPNVQRVRVALGETTTRMKLCTKCIRAGMMKKPLRRDIPEGLRARMRAQEELKSPEARRRKKAEQADRRRKRRAEAAARLAAKQG